MTPQEYQQVKSAFRSALNLLPEQRETALRQAFEPHETLLTAVLALLTADSASHTSIDQPAVSPQFQLRIRSLAHSPSRH